MSIPTVHGLLQPLLQKYITNNSTDSAVEFGKSLKALIDYQSNYNKSSVTFSQTLSQLQANGCELMNLDIKYKLAGLTILDCLLDVNDGDPNDANGQKRRVDIINYLFIRNGVIFEYCKLSLDVIASVLRCAAAIVGHFGRVGNTVESDEVLMNHFIPVIIRSIKDTKSECHRYIGALIMTQLAISSPALIFAKKDDLFANIWDVICDRNHTVRLAAADALEAGLRLISQRSHEVMQEYLVQSLNHVNNGVNQSLTEKVIGSLIIFDIMVQGVVVSAAELHDKLKEQKIEVQDLIWKVVLLKKESRDFDVRKKVMDIIPNLASAFSSNFTSTNKYISDNYLHYIVKYLLDVIKTKKSYPDRPIAYVCLGKLVVAISQAFRSSAQSSLIADIYASIGDGFREPFCVQALHCLAMVTNVSQAGRKYINAELVDAMFKGGLTQDLIDSLKIILKHASSIRPHVQNQLRHHIKSILLRHAVAIDSASLAYRSLRVPLNSSTASTGLFGHKIQSSSIGWSGSSTFISSPEKRKASPAKHSWGGVFNTITPDCLSPLTQHADAHIILALQVLASTDFFPKLRERSYGTNSDEDDQSLNLLNVVEDAVIRYLNDANPQIRNAASMTCLSVLHIVEKMIDPSTMEFECMVNLIDRLLILGKGDDCSEIRAKVFSSISPNLDHIVLMSRGLHCIMHSLEDESIQVRAACTSLLSRIAQYDTLRILPVMTLNLKQLLMQLNGSVNKRVQRESVELLQAMVKGSSSLIRPFVIQLLDPLIALLQDPSPVIVVTALKTIGELAVASPESVRKYHDVVFTSLINALNDDSSLITKETAVVALGKLVLSLSSDETPYMKYDGLFGGLVKTILLSDESANNLRLQSIKTAGLLGPVEVGVYLQHLRANAGVADGFSSIDQSGDDEESDVGSLPKKTKISKIDRFYLKVVIKGLIDIIKDNNLSMFHQDASTVAVKVISIAPGDSLTLIGHLLGSIITRIYLTETGNNLRENLLNLVVYLIHIVGKPMRKFKELLVNVIVDHLESYLSHCLDLLESICIVFSSHEHNTVLSRTIPILLNVVKEESLQESLPNSSLTMSSIVEKDETMSNLNGVNASSSSSFKPQLNGARAIGASSFNSGYPSDKAKANKFRLVKSVRILKMIVNVASFLAPYRHSITPLAIKVMMNEDAHVETRKVALRALMKLGQYSDLHDFSSRVIHSIGHMLVSNEPQLQKFALTALSSLLCKLGPGYIPYVIPVRRLCGASTLLSAGNTKPYQLEEYENLVLKLLKNRPLPLEPPLSAQDMSFNSNDDIRNRIGQMSLNLSDIKPINWQAIETVWALAGQNSANDLVNWMDRLSVELIRQSPSPILRACDALVKAYPPLAEQLFNASFYCIWDVKLASDNNSVIDDVRIINSIEMALQSKHITAKIMHTLLNLAEFMDMQNKRLPLDVITLARKAEAANMFSKCLRYRELEFNSVNCLPSGECIEALISVNNELGLTDRATGVLHYISSKYDHIDIEPLWLEKLCHWDHARNSYAQQHAKWQAEYQAQPDPAKHINIVNSELGIMRCLRALGEFNELEVSAQKIKDRVKTEENVENYNAWMSEIQRMGANASWMLGHWDTMNDFLDVEISNDPHDIELTNKTSFYKAILSIHNHDYNQALALINQTRSDLSSVISSLLSENYSRAYRAMISMQILAEMEEVVEYKEAEYKSASDIETLTASVGGRSKSNRKLGGHSISNVDLRRVKDGLLKRWRGRLKWAPKDVEVYRQILTVRTLVAEPSEDLDSWLELITLCRKEGMYSLCENLLRQLGAPLSPTHKNTAENVLTIDGAEEPFSIDNHELHSNVTVSDPPSSLSMHVNDTKCNHRVMFSMFKYWFASNRKSLALESLTFFIKHLDVYIPEGSISVEDSNSFRVKCLLRRAEWMRHLDDSPLSHVLETVSEATTIAPNHYSVWHAWAVINYEYLKRADIKLEADSKSRSNTVGNFSDIKQSTYRGKHHRSTASLANLTENNSEAEADLNTIYIINAITGFVRSIVLGQGQPVANILQDTLRILTLWFSYGSENQRIQEFLAAELDKISSDRWLSVIPQLIARMQFKSKAINDILRKILIKLARFHPQALVCPISVALNTNDKEQEKMAKDIIHEIKKKDAAGLVLVSEATMVSQELMRVAISPHELWHDGLEKAASQYLELRDINAMVATLMELHETMNDTKLGKDKKANEGFSAAMDKVGTSSLRDISFRQSYERQLVEASVWLDLFKRTGRTTDMHQAWEIYEQVFKRIKVQICNFKKAKIELPHVSPALTKAVDLELAVPGTYAAPLTTNVIRIREFSPSITVMPSKQRPRRISILGSDGKWYQFLLKGKEDLRQDERVMQLFGLINVCLDNDRSTSNRGLSIVRYSVMPLSNNSGVIGWVDNCDTVNALVTQYRDSNQMHQHIEKTLIQSKSAVHSKVSKAENMWGSYYKLPLIQKVDVFRQVLEETTGQDLAKILLEKSVTTDVWVERRANFTKSIAVMSIVGYILGLGDRHPSNLMLDRVTGTVVHIDFGDCFEVTAKRTICPEIIPFRLTRMIMKAMEASGIEGTFRTNAERTMRVIRGNRDSVLAMLEAFVYDPLISWRLLANHNTNNVDAIDSLDGAVQAAQSPIEQVIEAMDRGVAVLGGGALGDPNSNPTHSMVSSTMMPITDKQKRKLSDEDVPTESLNARALEVITRIQAKLSGKDFNKKNDDDLQVEQQVDRLIKEASSVENLCQLYIGWCPLW